MDIKASEYIVHRDQAGKRLDLYISSLQGIDLSRSQAKKLIEEKFATVNGEYSEPSQILKLNDIVRIYLPAPKEIAINAEEIALNIIYEDEDIIVINKPKGMVTHPAPGHYTQTLVNALLAHGPLSNLGSPDRPGIVHRLDKDTSGVIVVAKNDAAYKSLSKQIKDRKTSKTYVALVHGIIKEDRGIIDAKIGRHPLDRKKMAVIRDVNIKSREAQSRFKVLKRYKNYTLVEIDIKTGRTHQIRVHMSHLGYPIVGDKTYGKKNEEFELNGQLLHAQKLGFFHPRTEQWVEFKASLPQEMEKIINSLQDHVAGN
ncbi:MAG: RluA family pseudouridine synthase [Candidatus Margulisiibacteriota bacterium]